MTIELGDLVPLGLAVRDANGALINAATISLVISQPDGTTLTPTPANPSTGSYTYDFVPTLEGRHNVRWVTTGPNTGHSDVFDVEAADLGSILSLEEAKTAVGLPQSETKFDDELRRKAASASRLVESICGDVVRRTYVEDLVIGYGEDRRTLVLKHTPVLSLTSLMGPMLAAPGYLSTDLIVRAQSGTVRLVGGLCFPCGVLTATYVAGRATVPEPVQDAAGIILDHLWQERRGWVSAPTVRGESDPGGRPAPWAIPKQAIELLEPYAQTVLA